MIYQLSTTSFSGLGAMADNCHNNQAMHSLIIICYMYITFLFKVLCFTHHCNKIRINQAQ